MKKAIFCIIVLVIATILISWYCISLEKNNKNTVDKNSDPTYLISNACTKIYNLKGTLNYKLISDQIIFVQKQSISWFKQPIMTIYDENKIPTWSISTDNAKLTNNQILYLYGHVKVKSLIQHTKIKYIKTNKAKINLKTQDVSANNQVIIYGAQFNSIGMTMRGNLRKKITKLSNKVKTFYKIQDER